MAALAPAPQTIGIFSQFFAAGPETLVMKEKVLSLTGDSFSIKLANGTPVLKVEGKLMSISGRKKMFDMQGKHVCSIVKEHFHIHTTYAVEDANGAKIMQVKSNFKRGCSQPPPPPPKKKKKKKNVGSQLLTCPSSVLGSKATATFTSHNGKEEILTMKGNWFDTSADIVDEAQGGTVGLICFETFVEN